MLRASFDRVASLYDEARPGYPEALFEDVVTLSRIPAGGRMLEIGCGTGKATEPFARRGYRVFCVELSENLARFARSRLAVYPRTEIRTGAFEDWPAEENAFNLAVSAEAFHWLDQADAYRKIARTLRSGGALALFWNRHVQSDKSENFFEAAQEVYRREAPELVKEYPLKLPDPDEVSGRTGEGKIEETGLFEEMKVRKYRWDAEYDALGYTRLLSTYSDHVNLGAAARERLLEGIAELIDSEFGGRVVKGYVSILYVARVRAGSP